jgi:2-oxo-4-hydroxy-4-carboxy-5-ureidoimidazoline decarboxylase
MPSLAEINSLDRAAFTAVLGHLFEHSPWVADETWLKKPFRDAAHLHTELCATMRAAPRDRQLALVRAHPDLAGRLPRPEPAEGAHHNKLTAESTREQASAGLNQLGAAELAEFQKLNAAYLARFGFPFIICARLSNKASILAAMQSRVANSPDTEFVTALGEIEKIVLLRLQHVLKT